MQLVDQTCLHILPDCRDSAADTDIFTIGNIFRALQSSVDSLGHKMERRAALHLNRVSRVVRQNKDWDVIGRRIAPPSLPRFIRPWSTNRPKHISSQDPRAHVLHAASRPFVVQARRAACFPVHLPPCARRKKPLEQIGNLPYREDYPCLGADLHRNHPAKWQTNLHELSPYRSFPRESTLHFKITYDDSKSQGLHKDGGSRKFFVQISAKTEGAPSLRTRFMQGGSLFVLGFSSIPLALTPLDSILTPLHPILTKNRSRGFSDILRPLLPPQPATPQPLPHPSPGAILFSCVSPLSLRSSAP